MAWAYFDTSALVRRYVAEPGRREVLRLSRRHDCVTSVLTPVELRSALRRRTAEGGLSQAQAAEVLKRVSVDRPYWTAMEVGPEVLEMAERLVGHHPLRTLGAVHLASAQLFAARAGELDLLFVSADLRLVKAAAAVGLSVASIQS